MTQSVFTLARRTIFGLVIFTLATSGCYAGDTLESVGKSADEWVKMRVETARLETAWKEEQLLVEATVAALNERAVSAEEKRDLLKAQTAKDREEMDGLQAKISNERSDIRLLDERLKQMTQKLVALRPGLPPRLSEALEMTYRSLAKPSLSTSERTQLVINIFNRCTQFNREVTVSEDVLTLEGLSNAKSLEVIYWGLSHGYAVDRVTHKAWFGSSHEGTWRWEANDAMFENVLGLIAVAKDKADPNFIQAPAHIARFYPATIKN